MKCAIRKMTPQVRQMVGPNQVGLELSGREIVGILVDHIVSDVELLESIEVVCAQIDWSNAFNSISRQMAIRYICTFVPELENLMIWMYSGPARLFCGGTWWISAGTGGQQGCPGSGALFGACG